MRRKFNERDFQSLKAYKEDNMNNFWIGFIVGGFICGLIGFLGAAILAASGRASRMEEEIEEQRNEGYPRDIY